LACSKVKLIFSPLTAVTIIIIIIIIRQELGLDRPVSASSNSLFEGLPSRLRPFGLQLSITLGILFLFILVTCRSPYDCTFRVSRQVVLLSALPKFLHLWSKIVYPDVIKKKVSSRMMPVVLFILLSEGSNFASI
jgi:hypothetical protein